MLYIKVPSAELWDEANEVFISVKEQTLQLEHSLVSLSKWESKWCIPFFSKKEKTYEQTIDYIDNLYNEHDNVIDFINCLYLEK